ncbi:VWA domain-containing protein [Luteococcus sp. Sow4_B9]|uniref:VWA domain-containing protein n=1 Tax=Luteococcus sp. Sow4_B9 TaxID=3438792 RepID=UPI003F95026A
MSLHLLLSLPEFKSPERLWSLLLLPILVILYLVALRLKGRTGIRYTNTGVLSAVLPRQSQWRRHLAVAMSLCSLVALAMAWARPMGIERVPRERATVVVVIDASQSMQATDVKPNRLDAAKEAAKDFIATLPEGFNVAVVSLSGSPSVRMPPSVDRAATQRAIDGIELQDGTALGDAITVSLNAIKQAPQGDGDQPAPGLVVMLSDGTNTSGGDPMAAAATARTRKVPVHTISYGKSTGYVDLDGKRERVPPDAAALKQIAQTTGGKSWGADSAGGLKDVYKDVKSQVGYEEVRKERTAQYALYALAFATVAALGAVSMAARWP